jgi:hypothetical protein
MASLYACQRPSFMQVGKSMPWGRWIYFLASQTCSQDGVAGEARTNRRSSPIPLDITLSLLRVATQSEETWNSVEIVYRCYPK